MPQGTSNLVLFSANTKTAITYKWRHRYNLMSAMERIYSRVDHVHLAHDHFLRGQARLELKFTIGFAVMLARACVAVKSGQPHRMRSSVSSLAA